VATGGGRPGDGGSEPAAARKSTVELLRKLGAKE
jgi:hypothetical protein